MKKKPLINVEMLKMTLVTFKAHRMGIVVLLLVLLFLSAAVGMQPDTSGRLYVAGEVASADVVAHKTIQVEDTTATQIRRDQIAVMQPQAYDLSGAEFTTMRDKIFEILRDLAIKSDELASGGEDLIFGNEDGVKNKNFDFEISSEAAFTLSRPIVQAFLVEKGLPWLESRMLEGVVGDSRSLHSSRTGVLIRNIDNNQEILRSQSSDLKDIPTVLNMFAQFMRTNSSLNQVERRVVGQLVYALIMPTLTINREATQSLAQLASQNIEPVYYKINRGEVIVHQGERVNREQQLKLQSLYKQGRNFLRPSETVGTFLTALLFSVGLFIAPSAKPSRPMRRRDMFFISCLVLVFGIIAKGLYLFLPIAYEGIYPVAVLYVFPVGAASGLAALIFASRRYCVTGLLVSFFSALLLGGGLPLFIFYFVSAMFNTWLVMKAHTRQDVVRNMLPYFIGLIPIGLGSALLENMPFSDYDALFTCLLINAVATLVITFSVSPVLELVFGYTTRFRLMELMNLEQPLLQELMVTIPGTYHHSLVVSNMVEAGAKSIGANSLLCKVGALYHDIGKLSYPDYFIENQFGGPNRHDKLAPTMSALILGSHVKKGVELAVKHKLGEDIEDIIRQHHGTGVMRFFYNKALEQSNGESVAKEDFCYPGPRPQSREAAIVMVADMVEASSRTLSEPTPARIKNHIDTILKGIFSDGQLDESELTFKDMHNLSESFARILTGLFHQRISYPEAAKTKIEKAEKEEEKRKEERREEVRLETDSPAFD